MDRDRPAPPYDEQAAYDLGAQDLDAPRRTSWIWVPSLILLVLAAGWCAFWFYAAEQAKQLMAGWIERERLSGRIYSCGDQSFSGFPFRMEFRCSKAGAELPKANPPMSFAAAGVTAAMQVYQPTLLLAEVEGPLAIAETGQAAKMTANWELAQISLRGTPRAPQRISFATKDLVIDQSDGTQSDSIFMAEEAELHGRLASGTVTDNPVIDVATSLKGATAPNLHPLLKQPVVFKADAQLVGLRDFAPKTWTERFREIQKAHGRIDIRKARFKQGDLHAEASGVLTLTPSGHLDGDLQVIAAGIEKVLPALGIEALKQGGGTRRERWGAALSFIDKMAPGAIASAVSLLGEPAEINGRKGTKMLLRFKDGVATLGPLKLGQTPPLF